MTEELDPGGIPVTVGNCRIRTPGLRGNATSHNPGTDDLRGAELTTERFDAVLRAADVQAQETIELTDTAEVPVGDVATRSTYAGEPAIELEVPDAGDSWGQLVLATDESGVITWNFARDPAGALDATRGAATRTYVIRRFVPQATADTGDGATRGLIGAIGTKLLKVLVFPLIDPVLGAIGEGFVRHWEHANRPYRLRTFTPDDHANPTGSPIDAALWGHLATGRSLLFVHGTFSSAGAGFGSLPAEHVAELHRSYDGRVFAFDHPTLSADPRSNVEWFLQHVPDGVALDLDIVCHSRGGLVARTLAERGAELSAGGSAPSVRRIVFAGAPNDGTPLVDTMYLNDLIDSYTNLLNLFPDVGVTDVLAGVIAVAKQLAVDTVKGLDGLGSMLKAGPFLHRWLNTGGAGAPRYFAIESNYEPVAGSGFGAYAKDRLMDRVFEAPNDLVVPTASVYEPNGSGFFPIDDRLTFGPDDGVVHSGYFANGRTQQKILEWLGP